MPMPEEMFIVAASYTNSLTLLAFSPPAVFEAVCEIEIGFHPSWVTQHPLNPSLIFAGLEQEDGEVVAVLFDTQSGKGKVVGRAKSGGGSPCTLLSTEDELIVGNYVPATVSSIPVSPQPPYLLSNTPHTTVPLAGFGPNMDRQEASHAHQVILVPELDNELFVPDLGADKVWRLTKSSGGAKQGQWAIKGSVECPQGSGPRHTVYKDGILYTLLELTSELAAHAVRPDASDLLHTTSTLVNRPEPLGAMLAAELLLSPTSSTYPTPYLYASNRNDLHPEGDSIAIFSLANPNKPELVKEVRTGLNHLRGMMFSANGGKWLVAGGVLGGGVKIFERVDEGLGLREIAEVAVEQSTGFLWL